MNVWTVNLHIAMHRAMNVNVMTRLDHNVYWVTANTTRVFKWIWKFLSTFRASVVTTTVRTLSVVAIWKFVFRFTIPTCFLFYHTSHF